MNNKGLNMFEMEFEGKIPTVNHYWSRSKTGRLFISKAGQNFKKYIQLQSLTKHVQITDKPIEIQIHVGFARKGRDIDNIVKPILDALQGIVYFNDKQVDSIHISRLSTIRKDYLNIKVVKK